MTDKPHPASHRTPRDLRRSELEIRRVLVIGSCQAAALTSAAHLAPPHDMVLAVNASELPEAPPRSIGDYDFQIVQLATRELVHDDTFWRLDPDDTEAHQQEFERARERLERFLGAALRWNIAHGITTFVSNLMVPQQSPRGRLMPRYDIRNPVHFLERLNVAIGAELAKYRNCYLLDVDGICASIGRHSTQDDSVAWLSHGSYLPGPESRAPEAVTAVWHEAIAMFRTLRQVDSVKLVVVDLDNTLWSGLIGEAAGAPGDMIEGPLWPFGIIEALRILHRRGILLAIISKNDEERVVAAWNPIMRGKIELKHFAIRRINWRPKPENMAEILKVVNILPGNVVFLDDSPLERAEMQGAFPRMRIPADYLAWRRILLWAPETQVAAVTAESRDRTAMVQSQVERETQRQSLSREAFLASLDLRVALATLAGQDDPRFARAFELLNKTNQFNTTGRRWVLGEICEVLRGGGAIHVFTAEDKFTAYGLVGVVIEEAGHLAQVVMSCRVAGLDIELAVLSAILARRAGAVPLTASIVPTEANFMCRSLFARAGFTEGGGAWTAGPAKASPGHIQFLESAPA